MADTQEEKPLLRKPEAKGEDHHDSESSSSGEDKREEKAEKPKTAVKGGKKALDLPIDTGSSLISKALNQTITSTADLANLLPTGTVLAFQILGPIFTNGGNCDWISAVMTQIFLLACTSWCAFACFTDSFQGADGKVYYGVATFHGLRTIDYVPPEAKAPPMDRYRIQIMDFVHAILSAAVFVAIAMFDQSVVRCFYPAPDTATQEVLSVLPVAIGVVCSLIFTKFPTQRHGIGFPVTPSPAPAPAPAPLPKDASASPSSSSQ